MSITSKYRRVLPLLLLCFPLLQSRASAQGNLANGANVTGSIANQAQTDAWTFHANQNDYIWVSVSESGPNTAFYPKISLLGPDGSSQGANYGNISAGVRVKAPLSGTYTTLISRADNASVVGNYILTLAQSPESFIVPTGDQGGSLNNGQNYSGSILRGDLDQWSFRASQNDYIWLSVSETGPDTEFFPEIVLIGPDGSYQRADYGNLSAGVRLQAPLSGTYTAIISRADNADGVGNYLLTLAKSPGASIVSSGDEGGPITDGQNKVGAIVRGDLDQWSIAANQGDDIWLSVSETGPNTAFYPQITLIRPDGAYQTADYGSLSAEVHVTATLTGTYTAIVSRADNADGAGFYLFTLEKSPGVPITPDGDQGGFIINGQNYLGTLSRGDLDQWSLAANQGDDIWLSVSETGPDSAFYPQINLIKPDGSYLAADYGDLSAQVHTRAPLSGTYTVVVSRADNADGAGNYVLTSARSPAAFVVPGGDDGGPMASGQTYSGTVLRGDLDQWTFYATQGASITIGISETGTNTPFYPRINLIAPDGSNAGATYGSQNAQIQTRAAATGAYKLVVSRADNADGIGNYSLSLLTVPTASPAFYYLGASASPDGGGFITASPASVSGYYQSGTRVCLAASPAGGYVFSSWSGAPLDGSHCLTMNQNQSVVANFAALRSLRFIPVAPCRLADTRNPLDPFGGPALPAGSTRDFVIPDASVCNIPYTAEAYSLNVTVVPHAHLNYLTVWPTGQPQPAVSTLNSADGRIKANAAIIPAGTDGGVSVFATDPTDVILDINGYFVPSSTPSSLGFFPVTPCRIADTRSGSGPFGEPDILAGHPRTFPVLSSSCHLPSNAQAYSLNFTAVPKRKLGYLTVWPTGQQQPNVSTLNAPTGTVTANAAIVPAGDRGAIDVYASDDTDLIIDVNGYFAAPANGALSLYNLTPCRVLDTRQPPGSRPFSGTKLVNAASSACSVPASSKALVLNATVVPPGPLDYVTLWSAGQAIPTVSTLNALDGAITSNLAIVPDTNGSIDAYASDPTHLILDISGYFAP